MRLRPLDALILAVALAATVFVSVAVLGHGGGSVVVRISGRGGEWDYALSKDRDVRVEGPLGTTLVHIAQGRVAIVDSPCPNKTCVLAGSITRSGQWLACLPNKVFVRLEGGESKGLDAATW
ncbi:MAG TPA: NusG domain II-containing protein [Rectinemataceae bacterium]|nr:NusG domain II-containing protein [Rectinemataceae bacterium]